jgi:hypothetical protein
MTALHGCHGREPFAQTVQVQDGWSADQRRIMKEIPSFGSPQCEYVRSGLGATDPGCAGCKWRDE